jgi:hypothetical protein
MSIYDPVDIGPLRLSAGMINGDYITVELAVDASVEVESPYISDGALFVPVRLWELMQEARNA